MYDFLDNTTVRLPLIRRARGYYLYSPSGQRYLDMYLLHGTLILGHTPTGYALAVKNSLEQGMYAPYPNLWHQRLLRALRRHFDTYHVHICSMQAFASLVWSEPWDCQSSDYALWRPGFAQPTSKFVRLLLPAFMGETMIVLSKERTAIFDEKPMLLPATHARLLLRAFLDWCKIVLDTDTLAMQSLKSLFLPFGQVYGPYFFLTVNEKKYQEIYDTLLERGILFPPKTGLIGALPMTLTRNEERILRGVLV